MKHAHPSKSGKVLSLLLALALTLSLLPTWAAAVSVQDMNPKDDPLLGTQFSVDAVIPLATPAGGTDVSVTIPLSGVSKRQLEAAIAAGQVTLSLDRDSSRPYVNETLYPNAFAGGPLDSWMTEGEDEHQFTNVQLSAGEQNGKPVLNVSFHVNNYFYTAPWYYDNGWKQGDPVLDNSVPHVDGGYFIDLCGYFDLSAAVSGKKAGSAPVKVAPYESFYTMWEIYTQLDQVVKTGTENGLYVKKLSMGLSTAGRDMPYLIIADSKSSVDSWLQLTQQAESDPDQVLKDLESGKLNDIRVPVMYSNIHPNETSATDGVLDFAKMIVSEKTITYDMLTGFTAEGQAQLEAEMGPKGEEGSVAVPDLVKDKASYLGYLTGENEGISGKLDLKNITPWRPTQWM